MKKSENDYMNNKKRNRYSDTPKTKRKQFVVVLSYKSPHMGGYWTQIEGKSIKEVFKKLGNHIKKSLEINEHITYYMIDEIKFYFKYVDIIS